MNLQITLILIGILLTILLGLLIWIIRLVFDKKTLENTQQSSPFHTQDKESLNSIDPKPKYAHSRLQNTEKEQLLKKIIAVMEVEKVYQKSDLTISELAKQLDIPKHHLSQIINEQLGGGFIDFVNRYRVQAAKEQLQNPVLKDQSILTIGQQVGFHAKSTFYAAFKKYTNQTPAAFRKAGKKKLMH